MIDCFNDSVEKRKINCIIVSNGARFHQISIDNDANDYPNPNDFGLLTYKIETTYETSIGMYRPVSIDYSGEYFCILYDGENDDDDQMVSVFKQRNSYVYEAKTIKYNYQFSKILQMADYNSTKNQFLWKNDNSKGQKKMMIFEIKEMSLKIYNANSIEKLEILLNDDYSTLFNIPFENTTINVVVIILYVALGTALIILIVVQIWYFVVRESKKDGKKIRDLLKNIDENSAIADDISMPAIPGLNRLRSHSFQSQENNDRQDITFSKTKNYRKINMHKENVSDLISSKINSTILNDGYGCNRNKSIKTEKLLGSCLTENQSRDSTKEREAARTEKITYENSFVS